MNLHKGSLGPKRWIVKRAVEKVIQLCGLACSTRRGNKIDKSILILSSDMTHANIYNDYNKHFECLQAATKDVQKFEVSNYLLSLSAFIWYREQGAPTLTIAKPGSDFCHKFISIRNELFTMSQDDERYDIIFELLWTHRENADAEQSFYRKCLQSSTTACNGSLLHVAFNYAKMVLLPRFVRRPGQMYFLTGLKFDASSIHDNNKKKTFLSDLPKGHWPYERTANAIVSMLLHCVDGAARGSSYSNIRKLLLHVDNC